MNRKVLGKILTVFSVFISAISLKANPIEINYVNQEDLQKIQDLVDKKILTVTDEGLKLNEELNSIGIVNVLENVKTVNCGTDGSGM